METTTEQREISGIASLMEKLGQKAKREPNFRFYTLYGHLSKIDLLQEAWKVVKRNGGSAGIDNVTIRDNVILPSAFKNGSFGDGIWLESIDIVEGQSRFLTARMLTTTSNSRWRNSSRKPRGTFRKEVAGWQDSQDKKINNQS